MALCDIKLKDFCYLNFSEFTNKELKVFKTTLNVYVSLVNNELALRKSDLKIDISAVEAKGGYLHE
ncbi:MAG: hypothetical protein Ta2B_10540 [Termitinemataceae bacterium]|nr:MAG: hypothetical protein Ta2B_10540 [Termitinemataceae bacterium]